MDGADIEIEPGGWTPVQLVRSADVVVDIPTGGEVYFVGMDREGNIIVDRIKGEEGKFQMVFEEGMREYEAPGFSEEMFEMVPEGIEEYEGRNLREYWETVRSLRA